MTETADSLEIIDLRDLDGTEHDRARLASHIRQACTQTGFFFLTGHGVARELQEELDHAARAFFRLPLKKKLEIRMELGGAAWRGYFPLGEELTSGKPDQKEGLYFGEHLSPDDPRVLLGRPLHGPNLLPDHPAEFAGLVLQYMDCLRSVGHRVMEGVALSLGRDAQTFRQNLTSEPLTLFRIFHYPAPSEELPEEGQWGVGEHTDYGLLTLLLQDDAGGLEVHSKGRWIKATPIPNSFVCNIGDMLELITGGLYRSTPHRVLNQSGRSRLSFPFFFDPGFDACLEPVQGEVDKTPGRARWDGENVHEFQGTYGDYLMRKIGRVFPGLAGES